MGKKSPKLVYISRGLSSEDAQKDSPSTLTKIGDLSFEEGSELPFVDRRTRQTIKEIHDEIKPAEIRTTSATGGQKGKKAEELGAIDPTSLRVVARVAAFGSAKYERSNFLKGYNWSLSFDALQRHLLAFWEGEDLDPESGLPHTAHAAWHCLALISFMQRGLGTDDRFKQ